MGLVSSLVDRVRGAWTPRSRDRVFLWAVVGLVVSGAAIGCSGDEGLPSLGGGGPGSGNSETCSAGDERSCGITLEHGDGVMSCFRGVQHCEGERWGACTDGKVTTEPLPETRDAQLGRRSRLAYSSPEPCNSAMAGPYFNPCDPGCMYYDEDVPLNAGGAGMIGAGGVPDWGSPPATATCTHQLCQTGVPLDETCHPCVAQVCAIDATCCTGGMADAWDDACVDLVFTECAGEPPPLPPVTLCDFAAFGDVNVRIGNSATGYPIVGSNGNITPEPPAQLGGVYAKGTVDLRNGAHVLGDVVTEGNVWLEAPASIEGDVWAGGRVDVRNNSLLDGDITATGAIDLSANAQVSGNVWAGTTLNMSSGAQVGGWARSVGNMTGQAGAAIAGAATVHPPSTIAAAIAAASKSTAGPVAVPDPPVVTLPTVAAFDRDLDATCALAATRPPLTVVGSDLTLPPGVYGNVTVNGPRSLILQDGGSYVFNRINFFAGSHLKLAGTAPWDVSVCTTYQTDNGHTVYLNGTSTPPNGQDFVLYADSNTDPCIYIGDNNVFNGILIAPNCQVLVRNGTVATAAIWGERVWSDTNFAITNIPIDDCEGGNQWGTSICDGSTPYYADGGGITYAVGSQVHYQGQIYQCTNSGWCGNGGGFGGGAGYWPGEGANWADAWILVGACPGAPPIPTTEPECPVSLDIPGTNGPYESCYSGLECQVNSRCTEVLTDASCAHSKCATGSALDAGCEPCVAMICSQDASCCSGAWSASCVDMVETVCDAACGTVTAVGCAHDACVVGVALDAACDPSVAGVCATPGFAYCCSATWDQACVDQLYVQETGSPPGGPAPGETICDYAFLGTGAASLNSATIIGNAGWYGGAISMFQQWPGAGRPSVTGDLYTWGNAHISCGDIGGDYVAVGTATLDGCSNVAGTVQSGGTLPTPPPKPDYSAIVTCPTGGPDNWSASGTLAPGVYGNLQLSGAVTLQAGNYFIQALTTQGHDITLPADPNALVNIYVCGNIEFQNGADLLSPGSNPFQAVLYTHNGVINIGGWGSGSTIWGFLQANTGTISLSSGGVGVNLYGLAHSYYGTFVANRLARIDSSGFSRDDCLNRGIDPTATPAVCPIVTNTTSSVTESGTCVDNGDTYQVDASICPDVDLALGLSCDDAIPVCNHGNTALPANQAVISFYPRNAQQFGVASPDPAWAVGTCNVTSAIPAGTCVEQVCAASVVNQDLTAMVTLASSATVNECSELDNWTYYVEAYSCTGGATVTTEVQAYEAVCPAGTMGSWGFLTWDSVLMGNDTVTFEARTSNDGTFSGAYTLLGTAQTSPDDTSSCSLTSPLAECPVDIAEQLWPGGMNNQPTHLELRITLNPVGADIPAVNDWGITYTCQYDQ